MVNGLIFDAVLCVFVMDIFSCWLAGTALHPSHVVQRHLWRTSTSVHAETSRKRTAKASALKCISVNQVCPPVASWFILSLYIVNSKPILAQYPVIALEPLNSCMSQSQITGVFVSSPASAAGDETKSANRKILI